MLISALILHYIRVEMGISPVSGILPLPRRLRQRSAFRTAGGMPFPRFSVIGIPTLGLNQPVHDVFFAGLMAGRIWHSFARMVESPPVPALPGAQLLLAGIRV